MSIEEKEENQPHIKEFFKMIDRGVSESCENNCTDNYFLLTDDDLEDYDLTLESFLAHAEKFECNYSVNITKDGRTVLMFFKPGTSETEKLEALETYESTIKEKDISYHYWSREGNIVLATICSIEKQNKEAEKIDVNICCVGALIIVIFIVIYLCFSFDDILTLLKY